MGEVEASLFSSQKMSVASIPNRVSAWRKQNSSDTVEPRCEITSPKPTGPGYHSFPSLRGNREVFGQWCSGGALVGMLSPRLQPTGECENLVLTRTTTGNGKIMQQIHSLSKRAANPVNLFPSMPFSSWSNPLSSTFNVQRLAHESRREFLRPTSTSLPLIPVPLPFQSSPSPGIRP